MQQKDVKIGMRIRSRRGPARAPARGPASGTPPLFRLPSPRWYPGVVTGGPNENGLFWVTINYGGGYKSEGLRFASELEEDATHAEV